MIAKASVDEVYSIDEAISRYAEGFDLMVEQIDLNISKIDAIKEYQKNSLSVYNSKINFTVFNKNLAYQQKYSTSNINIPYSFDSINFFVELLGRENVLLSVKAPVQKASNKKNWKKEGYY